MKRRPISFNSVFTLFQVENIDSAVNQLTSHVTKTNKDIKEINNTMLRKVKKAS